jgi:hypothetical protein
MLIYPKLTPQNSKWAILKQIHYREVQEFVRGLLQGLGKLYGSGYCGIDRAEMKAVHMKF